MNNSAYYILTNKEETHYGIQLHDGLNKCDSNYFRVFNIIHIFADVSDDKYYLREVEIPDMYPNFIKKEQDNCINVNMIVLKERSILFDTNTITKCISSRRHDVNIKGLVQLAIKNNYVPIVEQITKSGIFFHFLKNETMYQIISLGLKDMVISILNANCVQFDRHIALKKAIKCGHFDIIQTLIDCIGNKSSYGNYCYPKQVQQEIDRYDNKLIRCAAKYNQHDIFVYLVERGANYKVQDHYCIRQAVTNGCTQIVQFILDKGCNLDLNVLINETISTCHIDVIELLVKRGAKLNTQHECFVNRAAECGRLDLVKLFIDNGACVNRMRCESLPLAAANGHLDIVRYLIEFGVGFHYSDELVLREAANKNQLDVVKYLVEIGANIHAKNEFILRSAASSGYEQLVKFVLGHGASVYAKDGEAFDNAVAHGNLSIIKMLFEYANLEYASCCEIEIDYLAQLATETNHFDIVKYLIDNYKISNLNFVLKLAVYYGYLDIVKLLCENGADPNANDKNVIKEAIEKKHYDVIEYLMVKTSLSS